MSEPSVVVSFRLPKSQVIALQNRNSEESHHALARKIVEKSLKRSMSKNTKKTVKNQRKH